MKFSINEHLRIICDWQAILFYVPRWLWKNWEAGKIHALMMDLDVGICSEVEKKQKKKLLLDYLVDNLKHHNWWAYRYFFCETLALANVIGKSCMLCPTFLSSLRLLPSFLPSALPQANSISAIIISRESSIQLVQ